MTDKDKEVKQQLAMELIHVKLKAAAELIEECKGIAADAGIPFVHTGFTGILKGKVTTEDYQSDDTWVSSSANC